MSDFFALLQSTPVVFVVSCTMLGLLVGSFLNVVIHRLPKMMEQAWRGECEELLGKKLGKPQPAFNLFVPRSACPNCGHQITALENVPVISYLLQKGRCRGCRKPISTRYPIVESVTGILSGYIAWHFGFGFATAGALLLLWTLIALTFIDFDTQLLPDSLTLPLLWLGLLFNLVGTYSTLADAVIGAVAGYLVLWIVYWGFKLLTGKEGMGYGDFKLLAALGAWMGWKLLPLIILLSSLVGAIVGISLILFAGRGRNIPIPFGPYLAGGGLIGLLWGQTLTQHYLQLIGLP